MGQGKRGRSVAILPSVGHLQLITTLKIGADSWLLSAMPI